MLAFWVGLLATGCTSQNTPEQNIPTQESDAEQLTVKDLSVAEFKAKMAAPNVVVLDVRTPAETAEGKIDGAVELDFNSGDFAAQLEQLDKSQTYLVYCQSGGRSSSACEMMKEKGFRELYNLVGGYTAWSGQ